MSDKNQIVPVNSGVLTGISIDELEDRLEMQLLGLLDVLALAGVETTNCPQVKVTLPDPPANPPTVD
ncbi:MAG TPA: hypothetical protein VF297_20340 [Pyrinomonadaceae bacterium]